MKQWYQDRMYARVIRMDGRVDRVQLDCMEDCGTLIASFPEQADWTDIRTVEFAPEMGQNKAGQDGYYIIPHGEGSVGDTILCRFREREDTEMVLDRFAMPIWSCIQSRGSFVAIVSSMTYEYRLAVGVKDGVYSCYACFDLNGHMPYEPITIEFRLLDDKADYNEAALAYREWREQRGELRRYDVRAKERPQARYTAESIYVRIRQGWKPVPPPVREQTPETEPEMHVAATFDDVSELLDVFQAHGIDKAEICLVGWNKSGHDGRWPQPFPVEERLGGEEALKRLTAKARAMGYAMVCHTNSTDAYSIADCWAETDILCDEAGAPVKNNQPWSGGDMYQVCPLCGLRQAMELLPKVRALGFEGTHYIDVISTVFPRACHAPGHPVTRRQCAALWNRILRFARQQFGGISSEGGFDFTAPELDFGLYVSFGLGDCPLADDVVPFWQLVYHGYILSNPYSKTVNPTNDDLLKVVEYGGRPTFYYDSKFVTPDPNKDVNWMGENDYHCHTPEDRQSSAEWIARVYHWYEGIRHLQTLTMERHEILPDGVRRVTYENGDQIVVDYHQKKAYLNGKQILPLE